MRSRSFMAEPPARRIFWLSTRPGPLSGWERPLARLPGHSPLARPGLSSTATCYRDMGGRRSHGQRAGVVSSLMIARRCPRLGGQADRRGHEDLLRRGHQDGQPGTVLLGMPRIGTGTDSRLDPSAGCPVVLLPDRGHPAVFGFLPANEAGTVAELDGQQEGAEEVMEDWQVPAPPPGRSASGPAQHPFSTAAVRAAHLAA